MATGSKANAISLGVFSMTESARRRVSQLKKLGFEPDIEKVKLPKVEYWLEWPREAQSQLNEAERKALTRDSSLSVQEKQCQSTELKSLPKK